MSRKLVACFSATGTTKKAAQLLAQAADADFFEIEPSVSYTEADLDWMNKKSRSSVEMNDLTSRPEIKNRAADMDSYDVIFLGFPIWWYREPSIIDTFLEQYDFSGKTIVLFATSGGSGFGKTVRGLKDKVSPQTKMIEGKLLNGRISMQSLVSWVDTLQL